MFSILPVTIGMVSLGVLALRLVPDWYRAIFNPAEAGLRGISPDITPVQNFYVVSKNFSDPTVDGQSWTLGVGGMVDRPLQLRLSELRALPSVIEYVTLECISNNVGGELMSTGSFKGVSLRELLATAALQPAGTWAAFKARDGYAESLPISLIQGAPEILVAYELDGAPLPMAHGYPARILIPERYAEPLSQSEQNITVSNAGGQPISWTGTVDDTAVTFTPVSGAALAPGAAKVVQVSVATTAFAGTRGISGVEYSTDGGRSWSPAAFKPPLSPLTWVIWQADWTPGAEGAYDLRVRATDSAGKLQTSQTAASYPSGASGYHTIRIAVAKS